MNRFKFSLPILFLSVNSLSVTAQTFIPPAAPSFLNGIFAGARPEMTACYSQRGINTVQFGMTDLYVGSWSTNDPGLTNSEVTYCFSVPGTPGTPIASLATGKIQYAQPVADLEVGMVYDNNYGENVLLVAYYEFGTGHQLDIYRINGPASSPFTKVSTIPLSSSSSYGRIRMDSHLGYGVVIVWENPGNGIETMVCDSGNWSGTVQLAGTLDEMGPDVAFSHSTPDLNLHFVYKNRNTNEITESVLPWLQVLAIPFGNTINLTPQIEDINTAPADISNLTIDCPDHYSNENWAYTYTDGARVYVRFINHFASGTPTTEIINPDLVPYWKARTPTIHYGDGALTGQSGRVMVAWYSPYNGGDSHYLAQEFDENLNVLNPTTPNEYYRLPSSVAAWTYTRYGVAFSKMSDAIMVPSYLYTTYITEVLNSGTYHLHHAFHDFATTNAFRGQPIAKTPYEECKQHKANTIVRTINTPAYPNPFSHGFNNSFSLKESSQITLQIVDIRGSVLNQHTENRPSGTHTIRMENVDQLPAGTYFLNTFINGEKTGTQTIIKN